jgi:hypothetical protein
MLKFFFNIIEYLDYIKLWYYFLRVKYDSVLGSESKPLGPDLDPYSVPVPVSDKMFRILLDCDVQWYTQHFVFY